MKSNSRPDLSEPLFSEFSPTSTEAWEAKIEDDLGAADYKQRLAWDPLEGVTLQPFYRAEDLDTLPHQTATPLTDTDKSPANDWRIRQDISNPDIDAARKHAQTALDRGATDIGFDIRIVNGRIYGVPIQTQDDMDALLQGFPLDEIPVHFRVGAAGPALLALYMNTLSRCGIDRAEVSGSIDYDPAAALLSGTLNDVDRAYDYTISLTAFSMDLSQFESVAADMRPYHNAGASMVQALALTLASLSETMAQATERGAPPDAVRDALHIVVPVGTRFFLEIGKLRALRLLVPQVLAAYDVDEAMPPVHAITARREQTIYDPHVNLIRSTTAATVAVMGGCDVLTVRPYDAEFEAPDDFAYRVARNTQLILKHESHLDFVADPAAGSYYVEMATDQLAETAWMLFQQIEDRGGLLEGLRDGWIQEQIRETRHQRQEERNAGQRPLVGLTNYPDLDESKREIHSPRERSTPLQKASIEITLLDTKHPTVLLRHALQKEATVGDVIRALQGTDSGIEPLPRFRSGEPFEALRQRIEAYAKEHDGPPEIFLLPIGDPSQRSARATFARNFFGVSGFRIDENLRFESPKEGAAAAIEADPDIVILCSSDAEYADYAPAVCNHLREADVDALVVVAGYPSDQIEDLEAAGVDGFIHNRSNLLDTLEDYQRRLGID